MDEISLALSDKAPYHLVGPTSAHTNTNDADIELLRSETGLARRPPTQFWATDYMNWVTETTKYVLKAVILVFAIYGMVHALLYRSDHLGMNRTETKQDCNCGNTAQEARDNGCEYDPIAIAWLPLHCRDTELSAEFESAGDGPGGNWTYLDDHDSSRNITMEEVAELPPGMFFTASLRWHIAHCSYVWMKQQRLAKTGIHMEKRFYNEKHVRHCYKLFLDRSPLDTLYTSFGVTTMADKTAAGET